MLHEVIMDAVLQSHKDVTRLTPLCAVCGTRCGSTHTQGKHANSAGPSTSRGCVTLAPGSPAGNTVTAVSTTPIAKDKTDGNIYFECTNCQKRIASNRYAPHLSGCLGIGKGFRRGAACNASANNKLGAEVDRGGSPFPGSDYGSPSRESINGKTKVKPKSHKKATGKINDLEINGSQKRAGSSLSGTPTKKTNKKEIADEKSYTPPGPKIPAKSSATSASPYVPASPSVSQHSGRDSPSASASQSVSSFNAHSPNGYVKPSSKKMYKPGSAAQNSRIRVPPGTGPPSSRPYAEPLVRSKTEEKEKEDADFIDVDGEEQEESSSDSSDS
ncbi:hypothetical protein BU17DRAFT_89134 [Hysterangium stoloniferum]|nr:hypothetical protein BU17DRAFT_89134 [Hysterangium stoloniferum]